MGTSIALQKTKGAGAAPAASGGGAAQVQKAELVFYDLSEAPGGATPGAERGRLAFQFNPKEVTVAKTAKWERKPARGSKAAGPPEFSGPEPCKLTLEMFFDATVNGQPDSVLTAVETLMTGLVPTDKTYQKKKPSPPLVVLHWGSIWSFPGYIASVSAKYTMFTSAGMPVRAACSVSIEEMPGEPFRQNPTSGSDSVRRRYRTSAGDSLASVAYAEYGDPGSWRALAAFNGIDDPMRVPAGTALLLPAPEDLARLAGR